MFSVRPDARLSMQSTRAPTEMSTSQIQLPRNPAPPVMRNFFPTSCFVDPSADLTICATSAVESAGSRDVIRFVHLQNAGTKPSVPPNKFPVSQYRVGVHPL